MEKVFKYVKMVKNKNSSEIFDSQKKSVPNGNGI